MTAPGRKLPLALASGTVQFVVLMIAGRAITPSGQINDLRPDLRDDLLCDLVCDGTHGVLFHLFRVRVNRQWERGFLRQCAERQLLMHSPPDSFGTRAVGRDQS